MAKNAYATLHNDTSRPVSALGSEIPAHSYITITKEQAADRDLQNQVRKGMLRQELIAATAAAETAAPKSIQSDKGEKSGKPVRAKPVENP